MNARPRTRSVERMFSKNFLKRAKECLDAARGAFEKEDWNASEDLVLGFIADQRYKNSSKKDYVDIEMLLK